MNNSIRDLELLDLITQDNLDKNTEAEVSARSVDPVFDLERKKALALREVIIDSTHTSLKAELQIVERQLNNQKQKKNYIRFAIAAIVILAIAALLYNSYADSQKVSSSDLYAMYYAPHPNVIDPLTKGNSDLALSGTQHYELGNYNKAITILSAANLDETSEWYLAQAYMANQNLKEAALIFDRMIKTDEDDFRARWFRALIHLQYNDIEAAKKLLKEIASGYHSGYIAKAKELLGKL